ncbi:chondroitinase family polysaccharide lyase [Formosa sediminum]|uniref:chondroitinase family polysaccharide lyase n=1 Tax=Formosa sediminum TaxID=2594004 RepID=UPI00163DA42C|nr:chondroitinase family polysaccharide lyase [Formosa sediminum]
MFFCFCAILIAQEKKPYKVNFENQSELNHFDHNKTSTITLSDKHYKLGKSSLRWDFKEDSYIKTSFLDILTEEESPLAYGDYFPNSPTTIFSIYNEDIQEGTLRFSFYSDANDDEIWFEIPLNFTGWRTIWVPFYEMNGHTPKRNTPVNFKTFKISTVNIKKPGTVFIDDLVFSQYQDDRYAYPDFSVPFLKQDFAPEQDHWMPSIAYYNYIENSKAKDVSIATKKEIDIILQRLNSRFIDTLKLKNTVHEATEIYSKLNLNVDQTVKGRPLTFRYDETYYNKPPKYDEDFMEVHRFGAILKQLADLYLQGDEKSKSVISSNFIMATQYFLDQGWQAGASGGTRHHIGYSMEDLAKAFFIMRAPLQQAGLLDEVGKSMQWVFNLGKILAPEDDFVANIDYFNTQSFYHLMIIFMRTDINKIALLLNAYSKYMSITLAQDNEQGVFKKDGTSWHHGGHYPAYGMGAFKNLPKVFRTLSNTQFKISMVGHQNFKKAILTTVLYSNKFDYGFANAGRHPLEDNTIEPLKSQFLDMAYSGNPDYTSKIDREFASAYLRLWGDQDKETAAVLKNEYNIKPETLPGYHVLPYASTAIHRRKDWAAIIKGYSKYVWASEIYIASNRYGRYPANGTIQLLSEKGEYGSGFNQLGWDWNRYPGATIIHLPLKELESDLSLLMFKSNQTFAGAVKQDNNGVFSMILDESSGSNSDGKRGSYSFPGKLKARKSVFSFGNKLICIGTNISSIDNEHSVETTLFQNYLNEDISKNIFSSKIGAINKLGFNQSINSDTKDSWYIDAYQNIYHLISDNQVHIKLDHQHSYHNKYSINTGKMNTKGKGVKETEGNYAVAWIDHGVAPTSSSYRYVIYPFSDENMIEKVKTGRFKDSSFQVIQADSLAHVVYDKALHTYGYSFFQNSTSLNVPYIKAVSNPSLIMLHETGGKSIQLSVVDPNLNFYDDSGKATPGFGHPISIEVTLQGIWKLQESDSKTNLTVNKNTTTLTFSVQDGTTYNFKLTR